MEIIDMHTHTFPDELAPRAMAALLEHSPGCINHTDGTVGQLRASMKRNGITRSVILPIATKPSQVPTINASNASLASDDLIPFGTVHPDFDRIGEQVRFMKTHGIRGVKFHPEYQDFYIDTKAAFVMYEHLSNAGIIALFHAGKDPGPFTCDHALPAAIRRVHEAFPRLKIVAAHMGGWRVWDDVEKELCGLPIYFDTSAVADEMTPERFVGLARKHGIEKLVFGTDSPWFDQGESRRWIEELPLTSGEIESILGGNAKQLLDI